MVYQFGTTDYRRVPPIRKPSPSDTGRMASVYWQFALTATAWSCGSSSASPSDLRLLRPVHDKAVVLEQRPRGQAPASRVLDL